MVTKRKADSLFEIKVCVTGKMLEDLNKLVAAGYYPDRSSLIREALGPFVAKQMEVYLFQELSRLKIYEAENGGQSHGEPGPLPKQGSSAQLPQITPEAKGA